MSASHFATLAGVVQTLAAGRAVSLPFAMGGRQTEWAETFEVGTCRVSREPAVLHRMTTRKGGLVREQLADATDWSLDDVLRWIAELDEESRAHMERGLVPLDGAGHTVEAIMDFDDGPGVAVIAGQAWRRTGADERLACDGDPKWSLDAAVMAVRRGR